MSTSEEALKAGCIKRVSSKSQITSSQGTLNVASQKDVCFQYGADKSCISEVDKNIDAILAKQNVFAKNITELKSDLVNTIGKELQVLQAELKTKVGDLTDIVEANKGVSFLLFLFSVRIMWRPCTLNKPSFASGPDAYEPG